MTVLIVEDKLDLAVILSKAVTKSEDVKEAIIASSVYEGIRLLQQCRPHIVLLDLNLPDARGEEFIEYVIQEGVDTRIIVTTAAPVERIINLGQYPGVKVMRKPFSIEHFNYLRDLRK